MMILDADSTFEKLDKLRLRMTRLEKNPDPKEWQYTRLLIRALKDGIAKLKKSSIPVQRRISVAAPEAVRADWLELVDVLGKKGIKSGAR